MNKNRIRRRAGFIAKMLGAGILTTTPGYAQVDMELMMQWADTTVIHWSVVGDYEGDAMILHGGSGGFAPVNDHIEIGFDYTSDGNGGLVGTPSVAESATRMGALRSGVDGCRAPTISGTYEHSTIESLENGYGGQLAMTVRTDRPAGEAPVACTGGNQALPAQSSIDQVDFVVPAISFLAMGDQYASDEMQLTKDKQSIIIKRYGWTYTYTPTKVR